MPRWIDPPRTYNPGQRVRVRRVAGSWQRDTPPMDATVVVRAEQFGDCYLVKYLEGGQDVVHVGRIIDDEGP